MIRGSFLEGNLRQNDRGWLVGLAHIRGEVGMKGDRERGGQGEEGGPGVKEWEKAHQWSGPLQLWDLDPCPGTCKLVPLSCPVVSKNSLDAPVKW